VAGVCAGPTYVLSAWALKEWGVDDVVGAFPVHGACGALGLLLPGVLGTQANYAAAFSSSKVSLYMEVCACVLVREHGVLGGFFCMLC